ncbi:hypothetical protein, partial [Bradyrhizobium sp. ORS 285]|uniref:hypothetical protein n=1 Tax=Bradyrhizobium sp. ORS 285 TaxID=115808 RepID=UPI001584DD38
MAGESATTGVLESKLYEAFDQFSGFGPVDAVSKTTLPQASAVQEAAPSGTRTLASDNLVGNLGPTASNAQTQSNLIASTADPGLFQPAAAAAESSGPGPRGSEQSNNSGTSLEDAPTSAAQLTASQPTATAPLQSLGAQLAPTLGQAAVSAVARSDQQGSSSAGASSSTGSSTSTPPNTTPAVVLPGSEGGSNTGNPTPGTTTDTGSSGGTTTVGVVVSGGTTTPVVTVNTGVTNGGGTTIPGIDIGGSNPPVPPPGGTSISLTATDIPLVGTVDVTASVNLTPVINTVTGIVSGAGDVVGTVLGGLTGTPAGQSPQDTDLTIAAQLLDVPVVGDLGAAAAVTLDPVEALLGRDIDIN